MRPLPGFRDFYPEDCARRGYLLDGWRAVACRHGFVEVDGPVLESMDLYAKKNESGAEILGQLYQFTDRGEREVALRPEMTPTLARMVIAKERDYRKPLKWFSIANFFRYERQQKGRLREFIQFNADLLGDASTAADAELISLAIGVLREFGFTRDDFVIRLSDRRAWMDFLAARGCDEGAARAVLAIIDKLDREPEASLDAKLAPHGLTVAELRAFIAAASPEHFAPLLDQFEARGLREFVEVDLSIVRGLAYYTGLVFEAFDRGQSMRALAGGGRYDNLLADLSDGSVNLPAIGFGLGDVVLGNLIEETPRAREKMERALGAAPAAEIYVVIAGEARRREALGLVQSLRDAGWRTDFPLDAAKVGRQFQTADQLGARFAVVVGNEWPAVKIKTLATRAEDSVAHGALAEWLKTAHV
ncbi:MAG: histidine--tRNA ligase [Terrimicrobiaceae bacterium]|nr:histidine--tRNA ligase [Terrimicrobiaceae bacterium]